MCWQLAVLCCSLVLVMHVQSLGHAVLCAKGYCQAWCVIVMRVVKNITGQRRHVCSLMISELWLCTSGLPLLMCASNSLPGVHRCGGFSDRFWLSCRDPRRLAIGMWEERVLRALAAGQARHQPVCSCGYYAAYCSPSLLVALRFGFNRLAF